MNDTTPEAWKKQHEIMLAMSMKQRFMEGIDMIDFTRRLVETGIRRHNSGISDVELKIEVFKRYYKDEFTEAQLNEIFRFFRSHSLLEST